MLIIVLWITVGLALSYAFNLMIIQACPLCKGEGCIPEVIAVLNDGFVEYNWEQCPCNNKAVNVLFILIKRKGSKC